VKAFAEGGDGFTLIGRGLGRRLLGDVIEVKAFAEGGDGFTPTGSGRRRETRTNPIGPISRTSAVSLQPSLPESSDRV
jgi:hypothetical protein